MTQRLPSLHGVLLRSLILLAFLEGSLWILATVGLITLPSLIPLRPFDRGAIESNSGTNERLFEPDRWTLTRLRANADRSYPRHPIFANGPEKYRVVTNSEGLRDREISREKPAGVIRVACLGDSTTFGFNVESDETYPKQLEALLNAEHPGRFQVLNFGVSGYATLQGVEQLKRRVLPFHPDVVTFAFGTNDRFWRGPAKVGEQLRVSHSWRGFILFDLRRVLNLSAVYRGLRALLERIGAINRQLSVDTADPAAMAAAQTPVVSLDEMIGAITEAGAVAPRAGFSLLVLNIDLQTTDAIKALAAGAERVHAPLLDFVALLQRARAERDNAIAAQHGLAPVLGQPPTFVFRVVVDDHPASVAVEHRQFPLGKPVTEPMYDDGTHGDEHEHDGVWSLVTTYSPGATILYSYSQEKAEGSATREFKDSFVRNGVPAFGHAERKLVNEVGDPCIDVYGTMYLLADQAHPDAEGHRLIATQLRDVILTLPSVRRALANT